MPASASGAMGARSGGFGGRLAQTEDSKSKGSGGGGEDADFGEVREDPGGERGHGWSLHYKGPGRVASTDRPATPSPSAQIPRAVFSKEIDPLPKLATVDLANRGRRGKLGRENGPGNADNGVYS